MLLLCVSFCQAPEEVEDLSKFLYPKFAQTYFQGQATDSHIRRHLKQPLLQGLGDMEHKVGTGVLTRHMHCRFGAGPYALETVPLKTPVCLGVLHCLNNFRESCKSDAAFPSPV